MGALCVATKMCAETVSPSSARCSLAPAHMQSEDGSDIESKQEGLCEHMYTQALVYTQSAMGQSQKSGLERWLSS